MSGNLWNKRTIRPECGIVFVVQGEGIYGGVYSNSPDLKRYIKTKAKQGWKLGSVDRIKCANREPIYSVWLEKGDNPLFERD